MVQTPVRGLMLMARLSQLMMLRELGVVRKRLGLLRRANRRGSGGRGRGREMSRMRVMCKGLQRDITIVARAIAQGAFAGRRLCGWREVAHGLVREV